MASYPSNTHLSRSKPRPAALVLIDDVEPGRRAAYERGQGAGSAGGDVRGTAARTAGDRRAGPAAGDPAPPDVPYKDAVLGRRAIAPAISGRLCAIGRFPARKPFTVYARCALSNPSTYMFCLKEERGRGRDSPEMLVRVKGLLGDATLPGTGREAPRGGGERYEGELLATRRSVPSTHLVDPRRNDPGAWARSGAAVPELMRIERYSTGPLMSIRGGRLHGQGPRDARGPSSPRAPERGAQDPAHGDHRRLEPTRRGGTRDLGSSTAGHADFCPIRTLVLESGRDTVQAGAGNGRLRSGAGAAGEEAKAGAMMEAMRVARSL